jgi:hypothetical protein
VEHCSFPRLDLATVHERESLLQHHVTIFTHWSGEGLRTCCLTGLAHRSVSEHWARSTLRLRSTSKPMVISLCVVRVQSELIGQSYAILGDSLSFNQVPLAKYLKLHKEVGPWGLVPCQVHQGIDGG